MLLLRRIARRIQDVSSIARCLATALLLCSAGHVWGDDLSLILNGRAFHQGEPAGQNYNEENWGIGLNYEFDGRSGNWTPFLHASEFIDSNENTSWYAGGGVLHRFNMPTQVTDIRFDLGLIAFVMHREGYRDGDLFPGVLPFISVGTRAVALNLTYVPKVDPKMTALFFLQLKLTLPSLR